MNRKIGKIKRRNHFTLFINHCNKSIIKYLNKFKKFRGSNYKLINISFVAITILVIFGNQISNFFINNNKNNYKVMAENFLNEFEIPKIKNSILIDLNENINSSKFVYENFTTTSKFTLTDKRAWVLDQYFKSWNSPLYGYGKNFVEACDKYGSPRDCVTVAAIAANETHLCKYHMSWEMKNCWGYGGGGIHRWRFNTIEEAIDTVTMLITTKYGIQFMNNPSIYELTFCGISEPECFGWGKSIIFFMNQIRKFGIEKGVDLSKV